MFIQIVEVLHIDYFGKKNRKKVITLAEMKKLKKKKILCENQICIKRIAI